MKSSLALLSWARADPTCLASSGILFGPNRMIAIRMTRISRVPIAGRESPPL
jgi:hypothetical protein